MKILPFFSFSMNKIRKYFFRSSKRNTFNKTKCEFCNKTYPDNIQQRLQKFKFRVSVECPNCHAFLDVYDF